MTPEPIQPTEPPAPQAESEPQTMSTTPTPMPQMNPTIAAITAHTATYMPAVVATVQAVEAVAPDATPQTKLQIAVNAIIAGSQALESTPNPNVAGIAALVNLAVSILNATGIFNHKPKAA